VSRSPSAAAKLDHSRVLVTKFHQNRSTLKGRRAGQTHTHRQTDSQTNSAENNVPSGLQSGQLFLVLLMWIRTGTGLCSVF